MLAREEFSCYTDYMVKMVTFSTVVEGEEMNFNTEGAQAPQKKSGDMAKEVPMQMICSGILRKNGEKIIYVRFERGADFAEGSLPAAKITSQQGFSPDEIEQFEEYMSENRFAIIEQAKSINVMKNFMK